MLYKVRDCTLRINLAHWILTPGSPPAGGDGENPPDGTVASPGGLLVDVRCMRYSTYGRAGPESGQA